MLVPFPASSCSYLCHRAGHEEPPDQRRRNKGEHISMAGVKALGFHCLDLSTDDPLFSKAARRLEPAVGIDDGADAGIGAPDHPPPVFEPPISPSHRIM